MELLKRIPAPAGWQHSDVLTGEEEHMGKYITRRILETILTLLIISVLVFFMMELIPGDPVLKILGEDADDTLYEATKAMYGFDKPVIVRYFNWLWNMLHGDFGLSYVGYKQVSQLISERLPVTLFLAAISLVISSVLGIVLGIITAVNRGKFIDTLLTTIANMISAIPSFWLAIVFLYIFSIRLKLLPLYGFHFPWDSGTQTAKALKELVLPVACLSLGSIASTMRQTRSGMLEVIRQDYIRTAKAKGLTKQKVTYRHALKNALVPIITVIGMRAGMLVGGSAFVEQVFSIPGMGTLLVEAVNQANVPVVLACVMLLSAVGCLANLIVDLLYGVVDPRIRLN